MQSALSFSGLLRQGRHRALEWVQWRVTKGASQRGEAEGAGAVLPLEEMRRSSPLSVRDVRAWSRLCFVVPSSRTREVGRA